ncbi:phage integrase SAM-like domain-containing protein [Sphingomonas sp.]|uniref:tyrosine-type recombinase/integrase n=1 Tax=Sphingomonas sp. TaxID=28214 RepID=UPI000DB72687|nr:phage integrase SAM-like domain-containing protein [Sphingomonas sp.]PZU10270.1 MAG: hypothetical protein DI605_06735 [Sphingomonas sp.]
MGNRSGTGKGAGADAGNDNATRVQLGPFWLAWRAERSEWTICWYDKSARTRRRRGTGVTGGEPGNPPPAAHEALANHYLEWNRPAEPQKPAEAPVAELLTFFLTDHAVHKADSARYGYSVQHLLRFFAEQRRLGFITGGVTVADITKAFVDRFIDFRKGEGVGGHTISRDLAALRGALNHAWRNERIASAPFIREVDSKDKAKPRALVYSHEQIAALLEAAWRIEDRRHVFLYAMIQLSTCGRSEAIMELDADRQISDGLIYFLDPDEDQTSKRRSIVPIAPTLAPWLASAEGRVIRYRVPVAERKWADPAVPEFEERAPEDIGRAFDACLIEAGISRPVLAADGSPVMLPARRKLGETTPRMKLRGQGTPNTLRHTIITEMHKRGVDERQIEMASGHAPIGTNKRNYMHLRPDYLSELIDAVEGFWSDLRRYTTVHLRTQCGPNVIDLAAARATAARQ